MIWPCSEFPPAKPRAMAQARGGRAQGRAVREAAGVARPMTALPSSRSTRATLPRTRCSAASRARRGRSCSASSIPIRPPPTPRRCTTSRTARPGFRWCSPARSAPMALASMATRAAVARCSTASFSTPASRSTCNPDRQPARIARRLTDAIRHRGIASGRSRHPLRLRSARRHRDRRAGAPSWRNGAASSLPPIGDARRPGLSRAVRGRRRPRHPQCGRLGGAGTRLALATGARLSARARSGRRGARRPRAA